MKIWNLYLLSFFLLPISVKADEVQHVNATAAIDLLQKEDKPKVLDVRTAKEFADGHIAEASNVDFQKSDFEQRLSELDKNQIYLIHCRSGSRSGKSLKTFKKLGFQNIIHLDGGINAWISAGGKIVE